MLCFNRFAALGIMAALGVAGCAAGARPEPETVAAPPPPQLRGEEDIIGAIGPQPMPSGSCGMFLWSRQARPELVFYHGGPFGQSEGAVMTIDNQGRRLPRVDFDGVSFFNQYEAQAFEGDGYKVTVTAEWEPDPDQTDGAIVSRATIRLEKQDGWDVVLPAGGVATCR